MPAPAVDSLILDVLQRIESNQKALSAKLDKIYEQPLRPRFSPVVISPHGPKLNSVPGDVAAAVVDDGQPRISTVASDATLASLDDATLSAAVAADSRPRLIRKKTFDDEDENQFFNKGEDIADFYGAMGWKKQIENAFAVRDGADCLTRFAYGPVWAFLSVVVIVVNTVIIGAEIQGSTSHHLEKALHREGVRSAPSDWDGYTFGVIERVFLGWMVFEILVNLYAQRKDFFVGPDCYWNIFDVLVVTTAIVMQIDAFANVGFLRVVRLLRLGKMLRAFRVFKFLRGIRSMLISISGSIMHLLSAMLLMCIFMFTVSLVFMQSIASETEPGGILEGITDGTAKNPRDLSIFAPIENDDTLVQQVYMLYGGVGRTMMTLFMTISGGLEWKLAAWPMVELGWGYAVLWTCYISFMIFGMLNVLTGLFVDAAFQAMMNDRDNIIQAQIEERHSLINLIRAVFHQSDTDHSGEVSIDEFQALLKNPEMAAYLSAIGIDSSEAQGLFKLLDDDGSGSVSIEEFVTGVMRLKGSAKSVDMVMLLYENRKISKKLNRIFKEAKCTNANISSMIATHVDDQFPRPRLQFDV